MSEDRLEQILYQHYAEFEQKMQAEYFACMRHVIYTIKKELKNENS